VETNGHSVYPEIGQILSNAIISIREICGLSFAGDITGQEVSPEKSLFCNFQPTGLSRNLWQDMPGKW
jgi:hypothetical protein